MYMLMVGMWREGGMDVEGGMDDGLRRNGKRTTWD
jgi:hypothetical protein